MRRWCTSPQNNRNHRWGRHLVSSCQHLFGPSILWPACNCSCARHYLLRSLPVFFPSIDKMAAAQDSVIVIMNDGHYQSEMTKAGAKLVVVDFTASWWVTVVKFIDQIMHFRIAWSLQLIFIERLWYTGHFFSTILTNSDTLFTVKLS